MLVGRQHRHADRREPQVQHDACERAAQVLRIDGPQHDEQPDMQRRRLVERLVETHQQREQRTGHAARVGPLEPEAQRQRDEARDRDQLHGQQPLHVIEQVGAACPEEERQRVQQVDRPVRHDRPRHERNRVLPAEREGRHRRAARGEPVRETVGREEHDAHHREPADAQRERRVARAGGRGRLGETARAAVERTHDASTRCARLTVKMPISSIRWSSLRKPARATSSSISACERRRITQVASPR
ncbi:hypothetical protein BLA39750_07724 [Burkholderia lata]|uniref:Uncharacterized protein n=1 Tax=Burkholderia lata (strain ATCC 17760 / DSM 23089 / LMG 22485 / NCIMB 9086 / R18194 / 383) TaxID=482957 RepID=A0A6P3BVK8_BURL3|nr:hypothetical protein BLA39750_07724 [Burkholderia lata]